MNEKIFYCAGSNRALYYAAAFLMEEAALEGADVLRITHEKIAAHMGTAREVVTRMLRYFQSEGMVKLTRGAVELTNKKRLQNLADS